MASRAQLVGALLQLPATERAEAARTLLESLDSSDDDPIEVEIAWRGEIARRVEALERGEIELEDGPTAMARLRSRAHARLARHRP